MDSLYEYMKQKLKEMRDEKASEIPVGFAEMSKIFQLVCYVRQIRVMIDDVED